MAYTTDTLLSSIKVRAMLPDSVNGLSPQDLLDLATEELQLELLALILSVREEFYVVPKDYAITQAQAAYRIPYRAAGLVLRDTQKIVGESVLPLIPISPEDISTTQAGTPSRYYFRHDSVILYPTPSETRDTLRLSYFFRPSRLALVADCAQITALDPITHQATVASIPSSWGTGTVVDFVSQLAPYANVDVDYSITGVTGPVITFDELPADLAVGDWLSLAETTPIPQLPQEFQVVLAQMAGCRALAALGQLDQLQAAEAKLRTLQKAAIDLIAPRNQGQPKKIVSSGWSSPRF